MGGYGSGNWYRGSSRVTTEEVKRIDIRYLNKQGLLNPNRTGKLSWNIGGEPSGNINYTMYEDTMTLNFKWQRYGCEDWQSVKQTICFDRTPCNYGGERKWFLCPHCHTRVAVLYGADVEFSCRHCYRLSYSSQGEDYMDRMMRKSNKISAKLLEDENGYFDKPKGMHWRTYNNLILDFQSADNQANNALIARFRHWL